MMDPCGGGAHPFQRSGRTRPAGRAANPAPPYPWSCLQLVRISNNRVDLLFSGADGPNGDRVPDHQIEPDDERDSGAERHLEAPAGMNDRNRSKGRNDANDTNDRNTATGSNGGTKGSSIRRSALNAVLLPDLMATAKSRWDLS